MENWLPALNDLRTWRFERVDSTYTLLFCSTVSRKRGSPRLMGTEMRRAVCLILAVAINAITTSVSPAQTNSWIGRSDGKWERERHWDDGLPSITQSAVIISNANSKVVTINKHTARNFRNSLTISNLTLSAKSGVINTLFLDNTGTIALHILNSLTIDFSPDSPFDRGEMELISTNSTLIIDGLLGGQLRNDGTMVITDGSLITTNCSLQVGVDV